MCDLSAAVIKALTSKLDPTVCAKIGKVIAKYRRAYEERDYDYFFPRFVARQACPRGTWHPEMEKGNEKIGGRGVV